MTTVYKSSQRNGIANAFTGRAWLNRRNDENPIFQLLKSAYYQEHVVNSSTGCYMPVAFPTGVGKTYNTLSLILEAVLDDIQNELNQGSNYEARNIYYITNSVDNVAEAYQDLVKRVNNCEYLNREQKKIVLDRLLYAPANSKSLLDLLSNEERILEKICKLFSVEKNAALFSSLEQLKRESRLLNLELPPMEKKALSERLNDSSSECYSSLVRHIQKVQLGDDPVSLTDKNIELISFLIPGVKVETGKARVVFMTTKKFLFGLQQTKGKFHPARNLSGHMLIIDEVDRQHQEILTHLVTSNDTDLLATIRTIHSNLKEHRLCTKPQYQGIEDMFEEYLNNVKKFFSDWSLQFSFDIDQSAIETDKQVLLFSDKLTTHNTNVKGKLCVSFNDNSQQHEIAIQGQFKERVEKDFPKFLGGVERLVNRTFQSLVRRAEERYRKNLANMLAEFELKQLTSSQAIASILDQLNLHSLRNQLSQQLSYLVGHQYSSRKSAANYHTRGIRLIEVDRLPESQDAVMFKHHGFNVSPTGMLASWVESGCCVLGVSATAECGSVIHNFDTRYLKDSLSEHYVELTTKQRADIHDYYDRERNYRGNNVTVLPERVDHDYAFIRKLLNEWKPGARNLDLLCKELFNCNDRGIDYGMKWLSKLCLAINKFARCDSNRYMLAMLNRNIPAELTPFLYWYVRKLENQEKIKIVPGINANYLKQGHFDVEVVQYLEKYPGKVIALTTYQTMSSGKNPDYKFNPELEGETLRHVGSRASNRTDIDFMYLEEPTHLISIEGKPETKTSDRLLLLSYAMALQEEGVLTLHQAHSWCRDVVTHDSPKNLCRDLKSKYYKKDSDDYLHAIYRIIEQAVGRTARTAMKRKKIYIVADAELMVHLSKDERDSKLFSHEYCELVGYAKSEFSWLNAPIDRESIRRQNVAVLHTARSHGAIKRMLNLINSNPNPSDIESWTELREMVLKKPASIELPVYREYYLLSNIGGEYEYTSPSEEWKIDGYRFFEQAVSPKKRVCESTSMLSQFMRNPIVKRHFEVNGFATHWNLDAKYILTPPMFINIYLGALGEEVGKAILSSQGFGIEPMPSEHFEEFDNIVTFSGQRALIDFKHWDLSSWRALSNDDRYENMMKFSNKLRSLNLDKLIVCNMFKQGDEQVLYFDAEFNPTSNMATASIISLPNLLNEDNSNIDIENITKLAEWMAV